MNKIFTLVSAVLLSSAAFAQAPSKMSYQSVIRNEKGALLTEKKVKIQISILKGSKDGESVYVETQDVATNANGLVSLAIGAGDVVKGSFSTIDWASGSYFIKTETDPKGGSDFSIVGVSELLSVPYALSAKNGFSGNYNDLQNKPAYLSEFINDMGFVTNSQLGSQSPASTATPSGGVPSQNWSLFGNSSSNPLTDKLGTTDAKDLVMVTNNLERLRILANGDINLKKSLEVGEDLNVKRNVNLNITGGETINNGNFTVAKTKATHLTGTLDVDQSANVDGATTLQSTLDVKNGSATHLTGVLDVDQTLNVDGATTLQNTLEVLNESDSHMTGDLDVDGSLNVDGAFVLNNTMSVAGDANFFGSVTVNDVKPTHLTGLLDVDTTLNVDGNSTLHGTLGVDGATDLNSSLNVDGITNLNSAFNVNNAAASHMTGSLDVDTTLNVDGASTLHGALNVNNAAATHLTGTLTVDQATTLNGALNTNGQMTVSANLSGGEGSYGAYPLRVQGSGQGIAVKLSAGSPDNSNNFITFFNSSGGAVGRIEGETHDEVAGDPEFIYNEAILTAEEVKAGVAVGLAAIPIPVELVVGQCAPCIAMAAADLVLASANLASFNVFAYENLGVTYQSGSADYAEWLERSNPAEHIVAGEIVGVTGGKITKATQGAQQLLVISTKPAILGNMPDAGKEKMYEKVAFMGQIPVKVRGIVLSGDYIIPSGKNDGTGVAVSPKDIKPEQYRQIVGVAWSDALISGGISTVNMAIGLNANDVANLAVEQEKKITALENRFSSLEDRLAALETGNPTPVKTEVTAPAPVKEAVAKTPSRSELLASSMPTELSAEVMDQAIQYLKDTYASQGLDYKTHPGLNRLFTDSAFKAQVIAKAQQTYKVSYQKLLQEAGRK